MSNGNSVKIRIEGDDSNYLSTLEALSGKTKSSLSGMVGGLADMKAGIDLATQAISKFAAVAQKGIDYNAQIEQLQTSFEVMTGSAQKAAEVVERLKVMGAETPYDTAGLASVTQLLMQYGFTADDAIEKMRMLGDIAQGNSQNMVSIATGYAQMSSAGKVNLQDIKQMINGGFNPLQEISERTGESMADLYDRISAGTMSVDEITESMVYATSEGGKFFQSMEKQSQTLSGQLSTLADNANDLARVSMCFRPRSAQTRGCLSAFQQRMEACPQCPDCRLSSLWSICTCGRWDFRQSTCCPCPLHRSNRPCNPPCSPAA